MKRRKKRKLTSVTLVKAAAREHVGMPPPTKRLPDAKKKPGEKHKPTLGKLLTEEQD